jgi:HSP20 family protein
MAPRSQGFSGVGLGSHPVPRATAMAIAFRQRKKPEKGGIKMALVKWRPFERDWFDRMRDMARFMEEGRRSLWEGEPGELGIWEPSVNIYERGENILVEADLPGMTKDAIDVRVDNGTLTLSGERKAEPDLKEPDYYRHERHAGNFCRSFTLPSTVKADKIEATYKDGVLKLTIPKAEEAKAKKIAIH